jgi:(2Fe-2S) ferredoxin
MAIVRLDCLFTDPPTYTRVVLVCQNRTCRKQGAAKVLAAFEAASIADTKVIGTGCLGECGSGPMVRVLPDDVWYSHVQPAEVSLIIEQHLVGGEPIAAMLYRKFHPRH